MRQTRKTRQADIARQAIVIVHGQGQQRPMETMRAFVEVLWTRNPELGDVPPEGRKSFIVPDGRTGLFDLKRITTPDGEGRKTDFFELYYADLLDNTPLRRLWTWLDGLLFVSPGAVSRGLVWPWLLLWAMTLAAAGLLTWVIFSIPYLLGGSWLSVFDRPNALALAIVVVAVGLFIAVLRFPAAERYRTPVGAVAGIVLAVSYVWLFWGAWPVIALAALFGILRLVLMTVLPLFGDAASYLGARTDTVSSRQALRKRGLDLLTSLHEDDKYDRIVVVAHSLGTVLAYDLLQLLWEQCGPTKDNPPTAAELTGLRGVRDFIAKHSSRPWDEGVRKAYQAQQWLAFGAFRRRPKTDADSTAKADGTTEPEPLQAWKVSDFVTLGSPLGHARFLITDSSSAFDQLKQERLLSLAPPADFFDDKPGGFIDEDGKVVHHAAMFSLVRWTNLYDQFNPVVFPLGDVISSEVGSDRLFGCGALDVDAEMLKLGMTFTHNSYWIDLHKPGAVNLERLREAIGIDRPL